MPKVGVPKICNYCKNHLKPGEKPVLEKHHRPCEKYNNQEHFKVCKPCARNYKKTENVRIWRAKKAQNKPSDNAIKNIVEELMKEEDIFEIVNHQQVDQILDSDPSNPIEMTSDDYIIVEEPEFIENEYVQSTELSVENRKDYGFTLFIQHPFYPKMSLDEDDAMRFQSEIENLIDNMIGNGKTPKFISHVLENGMWRVTSADEYTNEWFKEKASTFTCLVDNTDVPVQVVPYNELPRFICSGLIPGKAINNDIIFSRIQKQNPGLNTSRWCICEVKQQEREFLISFKVDHLSLKKIQEKNCMLNIGMNQVNLFICEETDEKVEETLEQIEVC